MTQDRRAGQREEMREEIRHVLNDVLRDDRSFRRNGHTLTEYLGKIITPDRLLLLAVFLMSFYHRVERVENDVAGYAGRTKTMEAQHERINSHLAEIDESGQQRDAKLDEMTATIAAQTELIAAQTRQLRSLEARLAQSATRGEMKSEIDQRLRPSLDRLEKALGTK